MKLYECVCVFPHTYLSVEELVACQVDLEYQIENANTYLLWGGQLNHLKISVIAFKYVQYYFYKLPPFLFLLSITL